MSDSKPIQTVVRHGRTETRCGARRFILISVVPGSQRGYGLWLAGSYGERCELICELDKASEQNARLNGPRRWSTTQVYRGSASKWLDGRAGKRFDSFVRASAKDEPFEFSSFFPVAISVQPCDVKRHPMLGEV